MHIPIVGMGGIASTSDAIEFLLAGASAIQVGCYNFVDPSVAQKIAVGIESYLERHKMTNVAELIGGLQV